MPSECILDEPIPNQDYYKDHARASLPNRGRRKRIVLDIETLEITGSRSAENGRSRLTVSSSNFAQSPTKLQLVGMTLVVFTRGQDIYRTAIKTHDEQSPSRKGIQRLRVAILSWITLNDNISLHDGALGRDRPVFQNQK
ncbi:uncharacterized protein ARMOST_15774 [Armillaria ostoyae]|uniref:Uncharacterized protein n=1 Tax=Armillaria ostoyae TaxID=47428 RepID=A0A284RUA7_ARMOS|nr:uncharacterized protein ARMOST_15774 [Armillaria ostoyae]